MGLNGLIFFSFECFHPNYSFPFWTDLRLKTKSTKVHMIYVA